MPLPAYTWQENDFVTASRLQSELRSVGTVGPFPYNGVGWHANRPVFRHYITTALPSTSVQASFARSTGGATIVDSGLAFRTGNMTYVEDGAAIDEAADCNGAGSLNIPGGYYLTLATCQFTASTSGGLAQLGVGWYQPGYVGEADAVGTIQDCTKETQMCWAGGILNGGFNASSTTTEPTNPPVAGMTAWYQNGSDNGPTLANQGADGSGNATRFQGFWASVLPQYGTKVTELPTITRTWAAGDSITSADLNAQIQQTMTLLNMPPMAMIQGASSTSVTSNTSTAINYASAVVLDTYGAWNSSTYKYTVPLDGLYLVMAFSGFDGVMPASDYFYNMISINGVNYAGPLATVTVADLFCRSSKAQVFSLNAGDTIQHEIRSNFTATANSVNTAQLAILWLGYNTAPSTLPTPPDTTYQFKAGTSPANTITAFNTIANDLTFLTQRPYTLAYASTSQTSLGTGVSAVEFNTYEGIVHSDSADAWGTWADNSWTAPADGYYLCVMEVPCSTGSSPSSPQFAAAFSITPQGQYSADYYQQCMALTSNIAPGGGGGATAVGIYYLNEGDSITPTIWTDGSTSPATYTNYGSTPMFVPHFEAVWLSE